MNNIKVAAATLNQTPLDWEGNKKRILEKIKKAKDQGVDFLCLPELCITGYGCEDAFFYDFVTEKALKITQEIAETVDKMVVAVGLPLDFENALYNCVAVLHCNKIIGIVPKQNLSSDGIHYEKRWFKEWPSKLTFNFFSKLISNDETLIGDLIFGFGDVILGFEICEDAWVIDRPGNSLAKRGVNLIFNPSASHFAFDKTKTRESFIKEGSRAFNCVYVYSNLIGNESGRIIFDGDCFIAQNGKTLSHFNMLDDIFSYVVNINLSNTKKIQSASFKPNLDKETEIVEFEQFWNAEQEFSQTRFPYHSNIETKFEQFEAITTLGLYDYMRKSKSSGYVVSLSGGIDSAVCALLVYLMCFEYKLNTKEILTCVYQKTKNSSKETEQAAQELAKSIGASYSCIDVDELSNKYKKLTEIIIGRELTWEKDDIALQNIQARVRSPSVWMVANVKNAILLSTSNRSEAAVGYATLDGDTSGGLAPIAGVDKQFLIEWINHNTVTRSSFYKPVRDALNLVLSTKPTAELRPAEKTQTDEKDLMPYVVLDKIERLAIHDKQSPKDVLNYLTNELSLYFTKEELSSYVKKFFQLWARNQYKRERYAVSFHLDDANLDPRSWCRFPVLSSGFEEELSEI